MANNLWKGEPMKKVITYTEEQVLQIQYMLNAVTITGIQNAKQVAAIAQLLESGSPGEVKESEISKGTYPVIWETLSEIEARADKGNKKEGEG